MSALGTFLISSGGKIPDFSIPLRLVASTYFVALAAYLYNDITDYMIDRANNRTVAHQVDRVKHRITICYTAAFFVIATILAFSINTLTGLASLVFSGLAIAYSHPRIQLKNMFVVKTAVTGAGAFITSMMGCLSTGSFSSIGMVASLIPFVFYFILGPLGDIMDLKGDKQNGRRTFPIVIGVKRSFLVMISATFVIGSIFLISNIFLGIGIIGLGLGILVIAFMLSKVFEASRHYYDKSELGRCRRSIRYCIFASQFSLLLGILFTGSII